MSTTGKKREYAQETIRNLCNYFSCQKTKKTLDLWLADIEGFSENILRQAFRIYTRKGETFLNFSVFVKICDEIHFQNQVKKFKQPNFKTLTQGNKTAQERELKEKACLLIRKILADKNYIRSQQGRSEYFQLYGEYPHWIRS